MSTTTKEFNPRLYVGTYNAYNNGSIAGQWLDLNDYADSEEFFAACAELHNKEEDPEFMFQDFEGFPREFYSESGGVDEIYEFKDFVDQSHLDYDAILAGLEMGLPVEDLEENYQGEYRSDEDFAYQLADDCGMIDHDASWPQNYIDWESAARDLMMEFGEFDGHYFRTSY